MEHMSEGEDLVNTASQEGQVGGLTDSEIIQQIVGED